MANTDSHDMSALEKSLVSLQPCPGKLSRDRLMFRAGQLSAPRRTLAWPLTTLVLVVIASTTSWLWLHQPVAAPLIRYVVAAPVEATPETLSSQSSQEVAVESFRDLPEFSLLKLESRLRRLDLDGLMLAHSEPFANQNEGSSEPQSILQYRQQLQKEVD